MNTVNYGKSRPITLDGQKEGAFNTKNSTVTRPDDIAGNKLENKWHKTRLNNWNKIILASLYKKSNKKPKPLQTAMCYQGIKSNLDTHLTSKTQEVRHNILSPHPGSSCIDNYFS